MPFAANLVLDNWKPAYRAAALDHHGQLDTPAMRQLLTQDLLAQPGDGYFLTARGEQRHNHLFGSLRGQNCAVDLYKAYITGRYPNPVGDAVIALVVAYANGVQASSWHSFVQVMKAFLVDQRTARR